MERHWEGWPCRSQGLENSAPWAGGQLRLSYRLLEEDYGVARQTGALVGGDDGTGRLPAESFLEGCSWVRLLYWEGRVMSRWRDPCVQSNAQRRAATGP